MTRLTVSDLQDPARFERLAVLDHQDLMPFIVEHYFYKTSRFTHIANFLIVATLLLLLLVGLAGGYTLDEWLRSVGWGLVFFFILFVPLHEALHALVYRLLGARTIHFGILPRYLAAYAIADRFVVGWSEFFWLALMPALVLTPLFLLGAWLLPSYRLLLLTLLALHTNGIAGDFALLNFFWQHREQEIYTYDEASSRRSYFYRRLPPPPEPASLPRDPSA